MSTLHATGAWCVEHGAGVGAGGMTSRLEPWHLSATPALQSNMPANWHLVVNEPKAAPKCNGQPPAIAQHPHTPTHTCACLLAADWVGRTSFVRIHLQRETFFSQFLTPHTQSRQRASRTRWQAHARGMNASRLARDRAQGTGHTGLKHAKEVNCT